MKWKSYLVLFSVLVLGFGCIFSSPIIAKELPITVMPFELVDSDYYDGKVVYVDSEVQAVTFIIGKRQGQYEKIVLENNLLVFTEKLLSVSEKEKVGIQGVYHKEGYYAGYPFDNFIVLDAIYRDRR